MDPISKVCFKCRQRLPLTDFYTHPAMADGHLGKCKPCARTDSRRHYQAKWAEDPAWVERQRARGRDKYHRLYAGKPQKHPHQPAHGAIRNAIRDGRLVKPTACTICNGSNDRIEGHHPDYKKPLAVIWLCSRCHGLVHRMPF